MIASERQKFIEYYQKRYKEKVENALFRECTKEMCKKCKNIAKYYNHRPDEKMEYRNDCRVVKVWVFHKIDNECTCTSCSNGNRDFESRKM